jgi:hypothetical protein
MKKVGAWGREILEGRVACSARLVFGLKSESGNKCVFGGKVGQHHNKPTLIRDMREEIS